MDLSKKTIKYVNQLSKKKLVIHITTTKKK